jgi:uncharacterized protein YuzE
MKLTYDLQNNIGYIAFREKTDGVQTIHLSEELNVDLAADGTVYGIELLNANEQLAAVSVGKLIVENAATGRSTEIELSV